MTRHWPEIATTRAGIDEIIETQRVNLTNLTSKADKGEKVGKTPQPFSLSHFLSQTETKTRKPGTKAIGTYAVSQK
jgi:hypothetical protein